MRKHHFTVNQKVCDNYVIRAIDITADEFDIECQCCKSIHKVNRKGLTDRMHDNPKYCRKCSNKLKPKGKRSPGFTRAYTKGVGHPFHRILNDMDRRILNSREFFG